MAAAGPAQDKNLLALFHALVTPTPENDGLDKAREILRTQDIGDINRPLPPCDFVPDYENKEDVDRPNLLAMVVSHTFLNEQTPDQVTFLITQARADATVKFPLTELLHEEMRGVQASVRQRQEPIDTFMANRAHYISDAKVKLSRYWSSEQTERYKIRTSFCEEMHNSLLDGPHPTRPVSVAYLMHLFFKSKPRYLKIFKSEDNPHLADSLFSMAYTRAVVYRSCCCRDTDINTWSRQVSRNDDAFLENEAVALSPEGAPDQLENDLALLEELHDLQIKVLDGFEEPPAVVKTLVFSRPAVEAVEAVEAVAAVGSEPTATLTRRFTQSAPSLRRARRW